MVLPLGLSIVQNLAVVLFVLICAAIILIVLLQKGRGGGIGAAFGGGGAGSLLGTKTGDFLTWVTICLVALVSGHGGPDGQIHASDDIRQTWRLR